MASTGATATDVYPSNQWVHVVVTWAPNTARFYVNGREDSGGGVALTATPSFDANAPLLMGFQNLAHPGGLNYVTGYMDAERLYNRALSLDEVFTMYLNGAR